jgi:OOP family OmpA-OmpF porin
MSKKLALTLFTTALLAASAASACNKNDVVYSSNNNIVGTHDNGCVRTKWMAHHDKCGTHVKKGKVIGVIHFDFDKSAIRSQDAARLDELVGRLDSAHINHIAIHGHADKIGSDAYNTPLSEKRARAVEAYLKGKLDLSKVKVEVKGLGKQHQIVPCEGVEDGSLKTCLEPNRRVDITAEGFNQ